MNNAKQVAQDTEDQARDLQDRININMDPFMREMNKIWELTQQAKAYLMG